MDLYLFSTQFLRESGGIGNTTYYLGKEFSKSYNVKVYVSNLESEKINGIELNQFSGRKPIVRFIKMFAHFLGSYNKKTDNCIMCMTWRTAIPAYFINKVTKVKYIVLTHGNDVLPGNSIIKNIIRKKVLNNAEYICSNSKYTAQLTQRIVNDKKRITVIHPCSGEFVDYNNNTINNSNNILSIGRHEYRKGFQYVILALKDLVKKYPDIKYIIAGDGHYRKKLIMLAQKNGVIDNCLFLGRISEQEKSEFLNNCSLLVMPSFLDKNSSSVEGFGIVYIEANAHGVPVIGTYSGGIPDAVINEKTGLLIEEKNTKQIVEAIDRILSKKIIIDSMVCKQWAEKHYYPEISKQYVKLINKLILKR